MEYFRTQIFGTLKSDAHTGSLSPWFLREEDLTENNLAMSRTVTLWWGLTHSPGHARVHVSQVT